MRCFFHEMLKRRFLGLRGAASLRICYARRRGSTCGAVEGSAYARTQFVRNSRKGLLALSANEVRATLGSALAALHPPVCPHFEHYPTLRFNEQCFPDLEAYGTNRTILTKNPKSLERGLGDNLASARFPPAGARGQRPRKTSHAVSEEEVSV